MLSVSLYDGSAAHAAADAQSGKAPLGISLDHLVKQSDKDTASGSSYGMSESDRAAVDIELGKIEAEFFADCYRLSCESFVCFIQVELVDCKACSCKDLLGRCDRSYTHDGGIYAAESACYPCCHRSDAQLFR